MLSIIIPVRNEEKAIEKTIRSLNSLHLPHEIIVTDGGSTDRTVEIARKLGVIVTIHPTDKKQTISSNRNNGAKQASGEILVFIDSDCVIENVDDFFTRAIKHFEDIDVVGVTGWVKTQPDVETWADNIILGIANYIYVFMNNVLGVGAAVGKFQMIRKDAFTKLKGYNENYVSGEDNDMFRRLAKIGKTRLDSSLIVCHTNRRAHTIGWPKLLWIWTRDTVSLAFKNKAVSTDWTDVR
jgi:glycosyltransferase involved in cell wall biosynthesis